MKLASRGERLFVDKKNWWLLPGSNQRPVDYDSIYGFLTTCIEKTDSGPGISIDDLGRKYYDWCIANDWVPITGLDARRKLTKGVESLFHVPQTHDFPSGRGYHGVAFKAES